MAPLGVSLAFGRAELVAPLVPLFLLHPPQLLPCLQPLPCLPVALLMRLVLWSMVHLVMVMVLGSKVLCVSCVSRSATKRPLCLSECPAFFAAHELRPTSWPLSPAAASLARICLLASCGSHDYICPLHYLLPCVCCTFWYGCW